jgi:hypothetical protein
VIAAVRCEGGVRRIGIYRLGGGGCRLIGRREDRAGLSVGRTIRGGEGGTGMVLGCRRFRAWGLGLAVDGKRNGNGNEVCLVNEGQEVLEFLPEEG